MIDAGDMSAGRKQIALIIHSDIFCTARCAPKAFSRVKIMQSELKTDGENEAPVTDNYLQGEELQRFRPKGKGF